MSTARCARCWIIWWRKWCSRERECGVRNNDTVWESVGVKGGFVSWMCMSGRGGVLGSLDDGWVGNTIYIAGFVY